MSKGFSTASKWVRIGSNSNSTVDSEGVVADDSNGPILSGLENPVPGTAGYVRRECHVWLDEDGDTYDDASFDAGYASGSADNEGAGYDEGYDAGVAVFDFPADYLEGGTRNYIAFTLPPRDTLVCAGDASADNECEEEFDEVGNRNSCGTGGTCAQYEIDRTMKTSVFPNEEAALDFSQNLANTGGSGFMDTLFTNMDTIYTQQYDDNTGERIYSFISYQTAAAIPGASEDSWHDAFGKITFFEPGKGYFIQVQQDMYLYWRLGDNQ